MLYHLELMFRKLFPGYPEASPVCGKRVDHCDKRRDNASGGGCLEHAGTRVCELRDGRLDCPHDTRAQDCSYAYSLAGGTFRTMHEG